MLHKYFRRRETEHGESEEVQSGFSSFAAGEETEAKSGKETEGDVCISVLSRECPPNG